MSRGVLESPAIAKNARMVHQVGMEDEEREGSPFSPFATDGAVVCRSSPALDSPPPLSAPISNGGHSFPFLSPTQPHTAPPHPHRHSLPSSQRPPSTKQRVGDEEEEEEEEDEIVLGYAPTGPSSLFLLLPSPLSLFSSQRSAILKINARTGLKTAVAALLHPSHHPRSLWTLAAHREGYEPFVWAIFDSHEHALSALRALHPPTAEPALEADLHPFTKLRKVDMKAWAARWTLPSVLSYPSTHIQPYTHTYPLVSSYPFLKHEMESSTPIPAPVPPQFQPKPEQNGGLGEVAVFPKTYGSELEDHTTPIPPSCPPAPRATPNSTPNYPDGNLNEDPSEMKIRDATVGYSPEPFPIDADRVQCDISHAPTPPPLPMQITASSPRTVRLVGEAYALKGQITAPPEQGIDGSKGMREVEVLSRPGNERESLEKKVETGWKDKTDHRHPPHPPADPSRTDSQFSPSSISTRPTLVDRDGEDEGGGEEPLRLNPPTHVASGGGGDAKMAESGMTRRVGNIDCIEKVDCTATVGAPPKQEPLPAEGLVSSLPYQKDANEGTIIESGDADGGCPPDQDPSSAVNAGPNFAPSAFSLIAGEAPTGDYTLTSATVASGSAITSSQNGVRFNPRVPENPGGLAVLSGYGSRALGRLSPVHGRPTIQSRTRRSDEGEGGNEDREDQRRRLDVHYDEDDILHQASSTSPAPHPGRYHPPQEVQRQPFLHDPLSHTSTSSYHHPDSLGPYPAQHQTQQPHLYPTAFSLTGVPPPNAFRHGDWLCSTAGCGAHNFGRNVVCIMCGSARSNLVGTGSGTGTGLDYSAELGGRVQLGSGMTLSMRMGMGTPVDADNGRDVDSAYVLDGLKLPGGVSTSIGTGPSQGRVPTNGVVAHGFSSQAYAQGRTSTFIPVIPRFSGHQNMAGPNTAVPPHNITDLTRNSTVVQALGGMSQVTAIQEAIKAHQSQTHSLEPKGNLGGVYGSGGGGTSGGQRQAYGGGHPDGLFSASGQGGQLLIPTTLGNSPPTSLPQAPPIGQQRTAATRFGEAKNGAASDIQARNSNLVAAGMHSPGHFLSPVSPMQPTNQQQQHPLPPHPNLTASLFNTFSPASAAIAAAALPPSKIPTLLTPSGRKFAVGGRVQNISRDELNPILMFWPDNEPLPMPNQVRPPAAVLMALGGVQGPPPPILNTGNKGPIDAQPGDWTCGTCDYLNWRRRRVCANCFPHAEGNTEGTKHSTSDVQERVALLASVLVQQQQQVQAQQQQIQAHQATVAAFTSSPNETSMTRPGNRLPSIPFNPPNAGVLNGMRCQQQQLHSEPPRAGVDGLPLSRLDPVSIQVLAQRYGYAIPPPSRFHPFNPSHPHEQPLPLNLPPRMTQPSVSNGLMSRGYLDPLHKPPPFVQPIRGDGVLQFEGPPRALKSSPPSSRSSFSHGSNGSSYKNSNELTPSPLPLLPAFLQEVVGETSESSSSSVHESPSPPSPSSASSTYGNVYAAAELRMNELVGGGGEGGLRRRERSSPASGAPPISNNIHRTASHPSIWPFGYPGDRKEEGMRPI